MNSTIMHVNYAESAYNTSGGMSIDGICKMAAEIGYEGIEFRGNPPGDMNGVSCEEYVKQIAEGKKKYLAVQDEMNGIVELINRAQRRFMSSYKEVHNIIQHIPDSLNDVDDTMDLTEDFEEDYDLEEIKPETDEE